MSKLPSGCARTAASTCGGHQAADVSRLAPAARGFPPTASPDACHHAQDCICAHLFAAAGRGVLVPQVHHDVHDAEVEHLGGRCVRLRHCLHFSRAHLAKAPRPFPKQKQLTGASSGRQPPSPPPVRPPCRHTRLRVTFCLLRASRSSRRTRWLPASPPAVLTAFDVSARSQNSSVCTYENSVLASGGLSCRRGAGGRRRLPVDAGAGGRKRLRRHSPGLAWFAQPPCQTVRAESAPHSVR